MKISIVIPVYNEADSLRACLKAIAKQNVRPHEVIVVDNNSSDRTCLVAGEFDFVTLIHEKRQGVVHARTKGFNAATGEIIARIDGDSIVPADWLENMEAVFSDESIDAASGQALYYGVAAANLINGIDIFIRRKLSLALEEDKKMYLWGANMGIRRKAWQDVKARLCQRANQHEDFDIAIHLHEIGAMVVFDERLSAGVSSRRIDMKFIDFMHYVMMSPGTYAQHGIKVKREMYPVVAICAIGYLPGYLLYKGYDPDKDKFSLSCLFATNTTIARVDPTSYVA
jgi:glycosyltransferase involved in cell wall biosynthesis